MTIENNIKKEVRAFHDMAENEKAIAEKFDELIKLISVSDIDAETAKNYQQQFENVIKTATRQADPLKAFQNINNLNVTREELLDEFSILLSNSQFDSRTIKKPHRGERLSKAVLLVISIVMITLGFGMIIMPAPPFFEMFTIFYFNPNDGITIMDLISLMIILVGVYLLIKAIIRNPSGKK